MLEPGPVNDEDWMRQAIRLADRGLGAVEPNPIVGCVLVRDGKLIGQGWHQQFGGPHAEIHALADCEDARGATAYVTLEPCCHHGKTPPCSDALIRAGVTRVVIAVTDPFTEVSGGGIQALKAAGIQVLQDCLTEEAKEGLAAYLKRVTTGRPWVIAKWAMSVDGRIATSTGESQWITGEASRREVHRLRGRVDAIAVGMGTVIADDPSLTARPPGPRTAVRLVFARHRVPSTQSQLVRTSSQTPTLLIAGPAIPDAQLAHLADYEVDAFQCQAEAPEKMILEALEYLGSPNNLTSTAMTHIMVEGGGQLLGSFASAGELDECHVYIGSKLIGGNQAPGPVGDPGVSDLSEAQGFKLRSTDIFGDDVRLVFGRT